MTRQQLVGRVLLVILVVAILAGAGYALYRIGYVNGVADASDGPANFPWFSGDFDFSEDTLRNRPLAQFYQRGTRMLDSDEHVQPMPYAFNRFPMANNVFGRDSFSKPFSILFRFVCLGFLIWAGYKIITAIFGGKGWKLSFVKMSENNDQVEAKETKGIVKKKS
jgi:hypothetical protein